MLEAGLGGTDKYVKAIAVVQTGQQVGQFLTVSFNVFDKAGTLVETAAQTDQVSVPNARMIVQAHIEMSADDAASVEATTMLSPHGLDEIEPFPLITPTVSVIAGAFGPQARFTIQNPINAPLKSLQVTVLCRDSSKVIVGGSTEYPDLVAAKGQVLVKSNLTVSGTPSSCEAFIGAPMNWEEVAPTSPVATPSPTTSPAADAFKTWITDFDARAWSKQYQTLVPEQQAILSEQAFVKCREVDQSAMPRTRWVKLLSTAAVSDVTIPGTNAKRDAVKVTAQISAGGVKMPLDAHMYLIDGVWAWSLNEPEDCMG